MEKNKGMPFIFVVLCVVFPIGQGFAISSRDQTEANAVEYFKKYKYIDNKVSKAAVVPRGIMAKAVRKFQEMANLPVTGELNAKTYDKMLPPHCNVQDVIKDGRSGGRPWPKTNLTFKITNLSKNSKLHNVEQRKAIFAGIEIWSPHYRPFLKIQLTYNMHEPTDIDIKFVTRDHGDDYAFDGPGGDLAHTSDGKIHFDDDETWLGRPDDDTREGTFLYNVAAHQFGHVLGLRHSKNRESMMFPLYKNYKTLSIIKEDLFALQTLYGKDHK